MIDVSFRTVFLLFFLQSDQLILLRTWKILLWQSLRARTEKALVKSQTEDSDDSKVIFKQILSFTLTEKVCANLNVFSHSCC